MENKPIVEFYGEISDECRKKHFKTAFRTIQIVPIAVAAGVIAVCVYLGVVRHEYFYLMIFLAVLCVFAAVFFLIVPRLAVRIALVKKIIIGDETITVKRYHNGQEVSSLTRPLHKIKKVVDRGIFYSVYGIGDTICEKRLLTTGTIKDFEKIFTGKILRKV